MTFSASISQCLRAFRSAWGPLLKVQIPIGVLEIVQVTLDEKTASAQTWYIVWIAFIAALLSTGTEALTIDILWQKEQGLAGSLRMSLHHLKQRKLIFLKTSVVLGMIFVLCLQAYVVPYLYFGAIYLFVPGLLMTETPQKLTRYFQFSYDYAKRRMVWCVSFVLISFITFFGLQMAEIHFLNLLGPTASPFERISALAIVAFIAIISNALFSVWMAVFFIDLKHTEGNR